MKIDGKEIANRIFEELKKRVEKLKEKNIIPHLAIILIDKDPASVAYVNQKEIKGKDIGVKISVKHLTSDVNELKLLAGIEQFNNNKNIHGIIIQRPLPKNIDSNKFSMAVDPKKDVDGFHPNSKFQSPIALAVLRILKQVYYNSPRRSPFGHLRGGVAPQSNAAGTFDVPPAAHLEGEFGKWLTPKKIAVIGKGETGGQPIIAILKKMGVEPKIIDSKTPNPEALTKKADIIISAVGKPNIVQPEMLKKGVILIGVGLHKSSDSKLHGDYNDEKIKNIASFYTPTPGGVGPVNVAMLLENLVTAAENELV